VRVYGPRPGSGRRGEGWTLLWQRASIREAMATLHVPVPTESDRSLLGRIAERNEPALARLYDRYSAVLFAAASRIAGERSDAEEVVLDTFAQAWRDAGQYRPDRGSVIAWLTMICRSRALDLVRARGRRTRLLDAASAAEPETLPAMGTGESLPSGDVERIERRTIVARALSDLSPPQRQAIQLAYFEGLSHSEIAEQLGEPLGTVKTRVRLAMQKLRDMLRPYYAEPSA
jgi:RNA polymerase sigma-70 factor, ECF subfamily